MFNMPAVSMRELELESIQLLPNRETLCVTRWHGSWSGNDYYSHDGGCDDGGGDCGDVGDYGDGGDCGDGGDYGDGGDCGDGGDYGDYGDGGDCGYYDDGGDNL